MAPANDRKSREPLGAIDRVNKEWTNHRAVVPTLDLPVRESAQPRGGQELDGQWLHRRVAGRGAPHPLVPRSSKAEDRSEWRMRSKEREQREASAAKRRQ
jgi:hypothetical protein